MNGEPPVSGRIFLLSPANLNGRRGHQLLTPTAKGVLAQRLRSAQGAALGEVFSFVSGLYFRGKLTYARRFASPPDSIDPLVDCGVHIITPNAGLRSPDIRVTATALHAFKTQDIAADNNAYRRPLERSATALKGQIGDADVVLLGSIASAKYVDVLVAIFGDRLKFPVDFVGRGDMSRGGLLLRQAAAGQELPYVPLAGAVRHGARPPKLTPLCRAPR
jgi:hypothetical protein